MSQPSFPNRRRFLSTAALSAASLPLIRATAWGQEAGANGDIRLAVIGCRKTKGGSGQGNAHIDRVLSGKVKGIRVVAVCDADQECLDAHKANFEKKNLKLQTEIDYRKLLENKDIDAVLIATPNHLHTLIALTALAAGKHVYVEKPVSHNIHEGRALIDASKHYTKLILQHGMQRRSDPGRMAMWEWFKKNEFGKLQVSRGLNYKPRQSLGKISGPKDPPATVNYDLWRGPREITPLRREKLHYDWHWQWDTGNGDIGNQGPHQLDVAIWGLGVETLPKGVMSIGGRLGYDDDGETANTQIAVYDYPVPMTFDNRGLPFRDMNWKLAATAQKFGGVRIANVFEFENGIVAENQLLDKNGKAIKDAEGKGRSLMVNDHAELHMQNFVDSIKAGKEIHHNLNVLHGHNAAGLAHMANISYRLGKKHSPDEIRERIKKNDLAVGLFDDLEKHIMDNQIDPKANQLSIGPWLAFDPVKEVFTGEMAEEANKLANEDTYRKGFELPKLG